MSDFKNKINQLSFLLYFLFGGAIVGETVALTMAVTVLGPSILSNLYLINGILLLLLPMFFFRNIDKINRGTLLSSQLLATAVILLLYLVVYVALDKNGHSSPAVILLVLLIYPISYLSKTILFLTFWTMANDIYSTNESQKSFPIVAAWGFFGGLSGACSARLLLEKVDTVMIIGLWTLAYGVGWFFSRKITKKYWIQLLNKEDSSPQGEQSGVFMHLENILDSRLVRLISILYFCVFIAIFLQDYLFWKKSWQVFASANALASFQFTFYLTHGLLTIVGLRFVMPSVIRKWGFTRIFALLPIALLSGSVAMVLMNISGLSPRSIFIGLLMIQFVRYVVFENAFSPIYQMFFAAVPKEKRGRAKTFLEGVIKPSAIICSGIILIPADSFHNGIVIIIGATSLLMMYIVLKLRKTYGEALIPQFISIDASENIITKIGSYKDLKIVSLIREYSHSSEADVRSLAVKILASDGSKQAFKTIREIFENERNQTVREKIARSLTHFPSHDTKAFLELLLSDPNPRIRANALYSVNGMDFPFQRQFIELVRAMFFENNPRIQVEAARFLWKMGDEEDRKNVFSFIDSLCSSKNTNKRSAGLYLVGVLKPEKWEIILKENLASAPLQVFAKGIEIIFTSASKETQLATLAIVEGMPRKYIACTGRILQSIGGTVFETITEFLRVAHNQRMIVEMIHALRLAIEAEGGNGDGFKIDNETKIVVAEWARKELEYVYRDSFVWYHCNPNRNYKEADTAAVILEEALRDQLLRVCERVLDVMALLDPNGMIASMYNDFDVKDFAQRLSLADILESLSETALTPLVVPILRNDEWEDIAKTGKSHFHFKIDAATGALHYFVRSKNKWICFCALYLWFITQGNEHLKNEENTLLTALQNDEHTYLSRAAHFLLNMAKNDEKSIEPFELLQRVLSLKKTMLFRHIPAEKLMGLAEVIQCRSYKSGTLISREGEVSDHLYVVRQGSLKIVKVKNNIKTILSILREGETYGEIGLFNQAPRSASAVANEDCELWVIQRSALKKFLLEMPEIAYNFLEIFSEKLRKSSEDVAQLTISFANSKKEYL